MNILYLHGMASSHESSTAASIRKHMPEANVIVPDISIDPKIAFPQIDKILAQHPIDIIVGHSLGGFMAQKYRGYRKILLNPSLGVTYFYPLIGTHKYKHQRLDGIQTWHVDLRIARDYKKLQKTQYDGLSTAEDELTIGLFARYDFLTRLSSHWFLNHYSHRQFIPGRHFASEQTVRDYVVPAIRLLLSKPIGNQPKGRLF